MPLPRKTMPKRLGKADGGGTSAKACSDSSQGNATMQPAPRSTARRETGRVIFLANRDMLVRLSGCYLSRRHWYLSIAELIDTAAVKWKSYGRPTSREKRARCPEFPVRSSRKDRVCAFLLRKGA